MRSHLTWLSTGLLGLGLTLSAPTIAGAQSDATSPTTVPDATSTTLVDDNVQPLPDLAPGESPGMLDQESGPMLTLPVEEPAATATTDVAPAGPVVFDPVSRAITSDNSKTVFFLLIVTAVPSLSLGTALWLGRDKAPIQQRSKN